MCDLITVTLHHPQYSPLQQGLGMEGDLDCNLTVTVVAVDYPASPSSLESTDLEWDT